MLRIVAILSVMVAILFWTAIKGRENLNTLITAIACMVVIVVISSSIYSVGISEGLPVGERFFSNSDLPPEDIIQVVKTVDWENPESIIYLTLVPYNNMNGTRKLYRISWDDCETPANLSIGMKIVNNNGRIEQV